jgi:hypothetical protein
MVRSGVDTGYEVSAGTGNIAKLRIWLPLTSRMKLP